MQGLPGSKNFYFWSQKEETKMAEATLINYSFKELAELMVKDQNKHEGYWGVYVRFGIAAANTGPSDTDLRPSAIVPILEIGLQRFEELNNLSVDAAKVNPKTSVNKSASTKKGKSD